MPDQKIQKLMESFDGAGWHVDRGEVRPPADTGLRRAGRRCAAGHIDEMSNEEYQSLFVLHGAELRARFLAGADDAVKRVLDDYTDDEVAPLVQNLGGHDLDVLLDSYRGLRRRRPIGRACVFAYTVKGWGLPIAGDPLNHSMLLSAQQIDELRTSMWADARRRVGPLRPLVTRRSSMRGRPAVS